MIHLSYQPNLDEHVRFICLFTAISCFTAMGKYCDSVSDLLLLCVCGFFVYCLFWTTAENSLSQTYIRFINKTKQVYMSKDMVKICANVGLNIIGNSFSRNYLDFCLFDYFLFIVMQTARALSLNILNTFSKFSFLISSLL